MNKSSETSRKTPWYITRLPLLQTLCWMGMAVPTLETASGLGGAAFILGIALPPFGVFFALAWSTRAAASSRLRPGSIGRILGCYLEMLFGLGVSVWLSNIVANGRSSTAALCYLLVPVIWGVGGIFLYTLSWLLGLALETAGEARRTRRWTRSGLTVAGLLVLLGSAVCQFMTYRNRQALLKTASSRETPAARLEVLGHNNDGDVVRTVAQNPSTQSALLRTMAEDETLQYDVASNPNTPPDVLSKLSTISDATHSLKWAVSGNPSTPPATLRRLAQIVSSDATSNGQIKARIETNPATPLDVVQSLQRHGSILPHSAEQGGGGL